MEKSIYKTVQCEYTRFNAVDAMKLELRTNIPNRNVQSGEHWANPINWLQEQSPIFLLLEM